MSLTDKIVEKLAGALGWLLLKELRGIRSALERGVDSDRELAGYQPIFARPRTAIDDQIASEQADAAGDVMDGDAAGGAVGDASDAQDFMRLEILEMLAHENNVPITATTDLIQLGKDRGWLDASGGLSMLPRNYGD